jgi:predicted porin
VLLVLLFAGVTRVTNDVVNTDRNSTQLALGYTHSLSKRTNIYTSFSRIANDSKVNAGGLADFGRTERMVNVGIRHAF